MSIESELARLAGIEIDTDSRVRNALCGAIGMQVSPTAADSRASDYVRAGLNWLDLLPEHAQNVLAEPESWSSSDKREIQRITCAARKADRGAFALLLIEDFEECRAEAL